MGHGRGWISLKWHLRSRKGTWQSSQWTMRMHHWHLEGSLSGKETGGVAERGEESHLLLLLLLTLLLHHQGRTGSHRLSQLSLDEPQGRSFALALLRRAHGENQSCGDELGDEKAVEILLSFYRHVVRSTSYARSHVRRVDGNGRSIDSYCKSSFVIAAKVYLINERTRGVRPNVCLRDSHGRRSYHGGTIVEDTPQFVSTM